jgi:hypothetical protein
VFGSQLVLGVLNRFPILVMLGGGLLGWIAGEIIVSDPAVYTQSAVRRTAASADRGAAACRARDGCGHGPLLRARAQGRDVVDLAPEDQK